MASTTSSCFHVTQVEEIKRIVGEGLYEREILRPDGSPVSGGGAAVTVGSSRALTSADDGALLECTATVTLTVPVGLPAGFACVVIPSGTTSIASSGGALLNGATTTITRSAASNAMFAIQARSSASDSYVVSGA